MLFPTHIRLIWVDRCYFVHINELGVMQKTACKYEFSIINKRRFDK